MLIVLGTLCSRNPRVAAAAMAVVGFAVLFCAVISGYYVAGGTAAMLTFVLPVNLPASPSVIPSRLEGWGLTASGMPPCPNREDLKVGPRREPTGVASRRRLSDFKTRNR
jgi:hypothetical protein